MIQACPEVLGGLPIPRSSVEIVDGKVMNTEGKNTTKNFILMVNSIRRGACPCASTSLAATPSPRATEKVRLP
ncbi:MAG: 2-thiouracil desulfurase family protein [Treponemataceae bacterium]|nr:2-thiouracil desulfurase family protein [Treponemataceae bacterium]